MNKTFIFENKTFGFENKSFILENKSSVFINKSFIYRICQVGSGFKTCVLRIFRFVCIIPRIYY